MRPVRRDDATHPRELPDPVDEAAFYARRAQVESNHEDQLLRENPYAHRSDPAEGRDVPSP